MRTMPSTTENSEWTRKWTKDEGKGEFMLGIVLKPRAGQACDKLPIRTAVFHKMFSPLLCRPGLLQTLHGYRHWGTQLLGKQRHTQFLKQPSELVQTRIWRPLQRRPRALILDNKWCHLGHQAPVPSGIRAQLFDTRLSRLEVAGKMAQLLIGCISNKPFGHQCRDLACQVGMAVRMRFGLGKLLHERGPLAKYRTYQAGNFLRQQTKATAPVGNSLLEGFPVVRPGLGKAGLSQRRINDLVAQLFLCAQAYVKHAHARQSVQVLLQKFDLVTQRQTK